MNRGRAADRLSSAGININELRQDIAKDAPFIAGLIRAAEEALLIAVTTLRDENVKDSDL